MLVNVLHQLLLELVVLGLYLTVAALLVHIVVLAIAGPYLGVFANREQRKKEAQSGQN